MHVRTSPMQVLGYGSYTDPSKPVDQQIRWSGGGEVEYVVLLDADDPENPRRMTLAESVNGSRAPVGTTIEALCAVANKSDTFDLANGRQRTVRQDKWKVIDMRPAGLDGPSEADPKGK